MSVSDPLADFFTRIRNASRAGHRYVDTLFSTFNVKVAEVLKTSKFIEEVEVIQVDGLPFVRVFLRYTNQRKPLLTNIKRISSSGCRKYVGIHQLPNIRNGLGIAVLSTSKGVMTGAQARKMNVGGELLCYVW